MDKTSLKMQTVEAAVAAYEAIKEASSRPDKAVDGENLQLYNELSDWGFFEKYKISDIENKWLYVTVMAMNLASKTKNNQIFSKNESGKSKWELIQSALQRSVRVTDGKKNI